MLQTQPVLVHGSVVWPHTMTVTRAVEISGLSRSGIYRAIAAKHIEAVKHGRQTLLIGDSFRRYLDNLPAALIGTHT